MFQLFLVMPTSTPNRRWFQGWATAITELSIVLASILYVFADMSWALIAWEALAILYLGVGLCVVWRGERSIATSKSELKLAQRWIWLLPVLASFTGINSAITALLARSEGSAVTAEALVASLGIVLSWMLLQVGFAQVYQLIDLEDEQRDLDFPGEESPRFVDYLYFSFTLGVSFATSDVEVKTRKIRRVVLVHSVISFFYNALVVAIAFQVLQSIAQK